MRAEATERISPAVPDRAFWAAVLLCDLILLAFLPRIAWVAVAIGGLAAAGILLRRVEWVLAFLLLGMPLASPLALDGGGLLAVLLAARLLFVASWWLARRAAARSAWATLSRAAADPAAVLTLLLIALLALGLARTPAPAYGAGKLKSFLLTGACLYFAPLVLWPWWGRERSLDRFLDAAIVLGGAFAAVGLAAAAGAGGVLGPRLGLPVPAGGVPVRLGWLGHDPISAARLIGLWMVLVLWGTQRRRVRPWAAVALCAAGAFLMLRTGSRGPLAALALSPLALFLVPAAAGAARRAGAGLARAVRVGVPIALALALLFVVGLPASERERLLAILLRVPAGSLGEGGASGGFLQDPSVAFRTEMIRRGWTALVDGLPWGWGTGAFPAVLFLRDFRLYPHNLEAELALELGLPGLALLLGFLLVTLAHARFLARAGGPGRWLMVLAAMALLNAQVSGDISGNGELWFWAGMIGGLARAVRERPA